MNDISRTLKYAFGRKSYITGNRPVYVRERNVPGGGPFLILVVKGIILSITGVLQFAIEVFRICTFPERCAAWEDAREYYISKRDENGRDEFYKTPKTCITIFIVIWVIMAVFMPGTVYKYSAKTVDMQITEVHRNDVLSYSGEIKNKRNGKLSSIDGHIRFEKDGEVLSEVKCFLNSSRTTGERDAYLKKGDTWEFELSTYIRDSNLDEETAKLWNSEIGELDIYYVVEKITFDNDRTVRYTGNNVLKLN